MSHGPPVETGLGAGPDLYLWMPWLILALPAPSVLGAAGGLGATLPGLLPSTNQTMDNRVYKRLY